MVKKYVKNNPPLKVRRKVKLDVEERLRLYLSKVASALVQLGQTNIHIEMREDYSVITELPEKSVFRRLKVYADGTVHYCDEFETTKVLGTAKTIPAIKEELLLKNC